MARRNDVAKLWFVAQLALFGDRLEFDPIDVWNDLLTLELAFPSPEQFGSAVGEVVHQLTVITASEPGKPMFGTFGGWKRHAFQSEPSIGGRADVRIVYKVSDDGRIALLGFGHRYLPNDIYLRLRVRPPSP